MLVRVTSNQSHTSVHPEKTANISRHHQWLTREMTSEKPAQKFRTNDLGSVSDWMKQILNQSEALLSFPSLRSMIRSFQARLLHLIVKTFLES